MFSVGLVGLPNAGKSTLFNLLTKKAVPAENFPFCTIDPHDGIVSVPDERIKKLAQICESEREVYAAIEFRDIAGLVKNAHQGAGLGNQFLSHIREVDMILMVLRSFHNDDIIHVENRVNPIEDEEILMLELTMADQNSLEKMMPRLEKELKSGRDKYGAEKVRLVEEILSALSNLEPASTVRNPDEKNTELVKWRKSLNLLTDKPMLKVANVVTDGNNYDFASDFKLDILGESEVADLNPQEREELGFEPLSGIDRMIQACYAKLKLATFLTAGKTESRAWTFTVGDSAPVCAGKIHTDFEKKFIKAEVISYADFVSLGGKKGAVETGKMIMAGKDYIMQDGDVVEFKIGG
jgi:ribosome-binding ATPase